MAHLSAERLAAFLDEQPTPAELSHLAGCAACSRERGAYEALAEMAKSGPAIGQPLTNWNDLAPRLRDDGVIDTGRGFGRRERVARRWLQAAAAVLLMIGGGLVGRMTAGAPQARPADPSLTAMAETTPTFHDAVDAEAAAAHAQGVLQASMAFLASRDPNGSTTTPAAIRTRLAALDRVSQITGAALEDAPYDSVINTLYLNAQGQREASMRQLNYATNRVMGY